MTSYQRNRWAGQPDDPHPNDDLGYEIAPLDIVTVDNGDSDHHVLLPSDEKMLKRDAYMIIPPAMLYSVTEHR